MKSSLLLNTPAFIRETRCRLGLTQEKFAATLGVTLPTISRWENGRTRPSPLAIRNIRELIAAMGKEGHDLRVLVNSDASPLNATIYINTKPKQ
jgi:putative transcriptional regulator